MSGVLTFRPATLADLALLQRWDEAPHVVESDPNDDWGWAQELARSPDWREQWIAELDGVPFGFLQIIDPLREDSHYWGEDVAPDLRALDIWIGEAAYLGRGLGTAMMRWAIDRCFADPAVTAILIDPLASNLRARRFYERLGFRIVGPRRFGLDECMVYRLERAYWPAAPSAAPADADVMEYPPMPAYAIAVTRQTRFGEEIRAYLAGIDATLAPFGGRYLVHGGRRVALEGEWPGDVVVIGFPSMAQAQAWYGSPAYAAIRPLRTANTVGEVVLVEGVAEGHRAIELLK